MPITTTCPQCRSFFDLADEFAGKQVRCAQCKTVFTVPAAAGLAGPVLLSAAPPPLEPLPANDSPGWQSWQPPAPSYDAPAPAPRYDAQYEPPTAGQQGAYPNSQPSYQPQQGSSAVLWIIGGVGVCMLLLAGAVGAAIWYFAGPGGTESDEMPATKPGEIGIPSNRVRLRPYTDNGQLTFTSTRDMQREGALSKVYVVNFQATQLYTIEMDSTAVDAFLRLEDAHGQTVAFNDDKGVVGPRGQVKNRADLNAQILYTAPRTGLYRIYASSFAKNELGAYTLRVRQGR